MPNNQSDTTWKDYILSCIYGPILVVQVILVFLFYNRLHNTLLLLTGWILIILFMVIGYLPRREFQKSGNIPEGKSYIETTALVETGIYNVVRHPQFLSWIFLSAGLAFISQHFLSFLLVISVAVFIYLEALRADTPLLEKFGDDYKQYMQKVPRLNILQGILKKILQ
ncbi:MAG: isoprenylcysteine carboxylmethyltransferase family protein [Candidatus Methanofastidiosia archaeon]